MRVRIVQALVLIGLVLALLAPLAGPARADVARPPTRDVSLPSAADPGSDGSVALGLDTLVQRVLRLLRRDERAALPAELPQPQAVEAEPQPEPAAVQQAPESAPPATPDPAVEAERRRAVIEDLRRQGISEELVRQTEDRLPIQARFGELSKAPGTRIGEEPDLSQPSIAEPIERGAFEITPETQVAYAYIQPYQQPNVWAYRNYCSAGSAVALLSHWDANLPKEVDFAQLGREIEVDPNWGAWIRKMVRPINERVNRHLGEDLNWYRYGRAQSLADFRWIIDFSLKQNAVPFVTGLMTGGLPGWGYIDAGHIVTVYGYTRTPDGKEYISYADTSPPIAGYQGSPLRVVELNKFWRAVSRNSAQVW